MGISNYKTTIHAGDGTTSVIYHKTKVVTFDNTEIILDKGGYETKTTKARMNEVSKEFNLGYWVKQKDGKWIVEYKGIVIPFDKTKLILEREVGDNEDSD